MGTRIALAALVGVALVLVPLPAGAAPSTANVVSGYTVNQDDHQLYSVNLRKGQVTPKGDTGFTDIEELELSPTGQLFAVDAATDQLVTLDTKTGKGTAVGPLGVDVRDVGLAFDRHGKLWMGSRDSGTHSLYAVNAATGAASLVGTEGSLGDVASVVSMTADCKRVLAIGDEKDDNLLQVDTTAATARQIGTMAPVQEAEHGAGIAFDKGGVLWVLDYGGQIFTINPKTGRGTAIGNVERTGFASLAITRLHC